MHNSRSIWNMTLNYITERCHSAAEQFDLYCFFCFFQRQFSCQSDDFWQNWSSVHSWMLFKFSACSISCWKTQCVYLKLKSTYVNNEIKEGNSECVTSDCISCWLIHLFPHSTEHLRWRRNRPSLHELTLIKFTQYYSLRLKDSFRRKLSCLILKADAQTLVFRWSDFSIWGGRVWGDDALSF